jgi:hypothetical protein
MSHDQRRQTIGHLRRWVKAGGEGQSNAATADLLQRINATRRFFLSSTVIGGRYTIRVAILSFRNTSRSCRRAYRELRVEQRGAEVARDDGLVGGLA